MILVDANLLLYATIRGYEQHGPARTWLDARLNERARTGIPWESVLAFVRIASNPRIFSRPLSVRDAWRRARTWLDLPTVWTPGPTERHEELLAELLDGPASSSKLVADAHLAAIAMGHGLVLCSSDGDFARFRGLRYQNPLAG